MPDEQFNRRLQQLMADHQSLIDRPNEIAPRGNGVFDRYRHPVLTAEHAPIFWR
ncbi:MAG: glycosidase, partial [Planctomycetes bacterium]|nr:glycosidase [Planctomycetota bacterium]